MKWLNAPNSDEHVLCDDSGHASEYRVRLDPVTGVYRGYDGERRIVESLAIYPCKRACEGSYQAERNATGQELHDSRLRRKDSTNPPRGKRGAYKRGAA